MVQGKRLRNKVASESIRINGSGSWWVDCRSRGCCFSSYESYVLLSPAAKIQRWTHKQKQLSTAKNQSLLLVWSTKKVQNFRRYVDKLSNFTFTDWRFCLSWHKSMMLLEICNKQRKCGFLYETKEQSDTWTNVFGPSRWLSCYHLYGKRWSKENQSFISCFRFYCRSCQKQLTGNICWLYRREHWLGVMQWRLLMAPVPWCGTSSSSQLWLGNNQNVMNDPKPPKQRWTRPLSRSSSLQTE